MTSTKQIAQDIAIAMPTIARTILMEYFQSVDIPQTQLFALIALYEKGGCRLNDLSRILSVSAPTASGIVDRMLKAGLIRREHDQVDRRAINITITPKGKKLAEKFRKTVSLRWEAILKNLPKEEQENFYRIIHNIKEVIG